MPFRLSNAPCTFMRLMNQVLKPFLRKFVVVYFDDILIYSSREDEHMRRVREVLTVLQDNELYINLKKCNFMTSNLIFMWFVISSQWIHVDEGKIKAVCELPRPKSATEVRSFHGLATFYRCFIWNFSSLVTPITDCLKKRSFSLDQVGRWSFCTNLRISFTNASILTFSDVEKVFELECDTCGVDIGAVLSQKNRKKRGLLLF